MIAVADEQALYLLEFVDRRGLERGGRKAPAKDEKGYYPRICKTYSFN